MFQIQLYYFVDYFENQINPDTSLELSLGIPLLSDEGAELDGTEDLYFETWDMSLQFTYEFWFKGAILNGGVFAAGYSDIGTPLFLATRVGNDIVISSIGTVPPITFVNAYQKFKVDDWTFVGFSIGVKGSAK